MGQSQQSGCRSCVCSLLCYWSAGGDLCRACLDTEDLATFFVNYQHCPQGWTWSEDASKCYRGFSEKKIWYDAYQACKDGGGRLVVAKTNSSISNMIEAMNIAQADGQYWINARKNLDSGEYVWGNNTAIDNYSWAPEFPSQGDSMK